jgi:hypothetical protein
MRGVNVKTNCILKILKTWVLLRSRGSSNQLLTLLKFRQMLCYKKVSESNGAPAATVDLGMMARLSPMDRLRRGYGKGQLQALRGGLK